MRSLCLCGLCKVHSRHYFNLAGAVFCGCLTNCNAAIRPVHNRMPVLLHADEHDQWLHGILGPGLIDQSQKMTVAAMQTADMKV